MRSSSIPGRSAHRQVEPKRSHEPMRARKSRRHVIKSVATTIADVGVSSACGALHTPEFAKREYHNPERRTQHMTEVRGGATEDLPNTRACVRRGRQGRRQASEALPCRPFYEYRSIKHWTDDGRDPLLLKT